MMTMTMPSENTGTSGSSVVSSVTSCGTNTMAMNNVDSSSIVDYVTVSTGPGSLGLSATLGLGLVGTSAISPAPESALSTPTTTPGGGGAILKNPLIVNNCTSTGTLNNNTTSGSVAVNGINGTTKDIGVGSTTSCSVSFQF